MHVILSNELSFISFVFSLRTNGEVVRQSASYLTNGLVNGATAFAKDFTRYFDASCDASMATSVVSLATDPS